MTALFQALLDLTGRMVEPTGFEPATPHNAIVDFVIVSEELTNTVKNIDSFIDAFFPLPCEVKRVTLARHASVVWPVRVMPGKSNRITTA